MVWVLEYLWLDANQHMRSKIRVMESIGIGPSLNYSFIDNYECNGVAVERKRMSLKKDGVEEDNDDRMSEPELSFPIPEWTFDGSSTGQASTEGSEIILKPVNYIIHPFIKHTYALLVLCECYTMDGRPAVGNSRHEFAALYRNNKIRDVEPWFGLEQEFFFFEKSTRLPIGWKGSEHALQGEYYCGVNRCSPVEREIMDKFLELSLNCNLKVCGINQEVAPCQWEYQVGILKTLEEIDHLIFAKYILFKLCEERGLYTVFHPKPLLGNWNGSGCHINISTTNTRKMSSVRADVDADVDVDVDVDVGANANANTTDKNETQLRETNGYHEILRLLSIMDKDHGDFIKNNCGRDNHMRLTGTHETSSLSEFTFSVGGRNTSVRIPYQVKKYGYGYFEDRRPGSSINYYQTLCKYLNYVASGSVSGSETD
jgi:glutamine synthetase